MATDSWKEHLLENPGSREFRNKDYYFSGPRNNRDTQPKVANNFHPGRLRETGLIEKLCQSYGFIECAEQELRVFFHYSQFKGNLNDLEIRDPVEFEVTSDSRTGKPIACRIFKLDPGSVTFEVKGDERTKGTVEMEAKAPRYSYPKSPSSRGSESDAGRVSYQVNGESFFIPFSHSDVHANNELYKGDIVSFFILENKRNATISAVELLLVEAAPPQIVQGIVCSLKESFGFIERADKVSEIFFHYSEFNGDIGDLLLGDDVQFAVQDRNGKEVAVAVEHLPEGTVKFEDISGDTFQGTVEKVFSRTNRQEPLNGKVVYRTSDEPSELPYGEKDITGEFTVLPGDVVGFKIATDRRDSLKRATEIYLVKEVESINGCNVRETGFVSSLKDGFGFIQCCDRDARLFFHFSELIDSEQEIHFSDEVEFTVIEDQGSKRLHAIRVRILPRGTINLKAVTEDTFTGKVDREPSLWMGRSPRKGERDRDSESGLIVACIDDEKTYLPFIPTDADLRTMPKFGDQVEFQISKSPRTGHLMAVNIVVKKRNSDTIHFGFVATLKENFGFLEMADHEKEVFFRYSEYDENIDDLFIGDEIQFSITSKGGKVAAEKLIKLVSGTIPQETVISDAYEGKILRPLRRADPQQVHYQGLIEFVEKFSDNEESEDDTDEPTTVIPYGITGLVDKKTVLQCGEKVQFRIGCLETSDRKLAVEITAKRERLRAYVESVKGDYGFISYEIDEAKNLFFHTSEQEDESVSIQAGDMVEFCVIQNTRTGKLSASKICLVSETQRPERLGRLVRRSLGPAGEDQNSKFYIIRQPLGPGQTLGFNHTRALEMTPPTNGYSSGEESDNS